MKCKNCYEFEAWKKLDVCINCLMGNIVRLKEE